MKCRLQRTASFERLEQRRVLTTSAATLFAPAALRNSIRATEVGDGLMIEKLDSHETYQLYYSDGRNPDSTIIVAQHSDWWNYSEGIFSPATAVLGNSFVYVKSPLEGDRELWMASGPEPAVRLVEDLAPFDLIDVHELGDFALFESTGNIPRVFRTDATLEGTTAVHELVPDATELRFVTDITDEAIFVASTTELGRELWAFDFSGNRAELIQDLSPGPDSTNFGHFADFGNHLYFTIQSAEGLTSLWRTDGTAEGTELIRELGQDRIVSSSVELAGGLVFQAKSPTGRALWRTDGTAAGTVPLLPNADSIVQKSVSRVMYFETTSDGIPELWTTDGTVDRTEKILDGATEQFHHTENATYFMSDSVLYRSNGTSGGTEAVIGDQPITIIDSTNSFLLVRINDGLLALPDDGSSGPMSIPVPYPIAEMRSFLATSDAVYFHHKQNIILEAGEIAHQGYHQFWKTDGTPEGSGFVADWLSPPVFDSSDGAYLTDAWSLGEHIVIEAIYVSGNFAPDFDAFASFPDLDLVAHAGGDLKYDIEDLGIVNLRREYDLPNEQNLALDASGSIHSPSENVVYEWDLDGDGEFDDVTGVSPTIPWPQVQQLEIFEANLRVSGSLGVALDRVRINVGNRLIGDANLDGKVNFKDFLVLSASFGKSEATWSDGNFDGIGGVSFADFLLLAENFGRSVFHNDL